MWRKILGRTKSTRSETVSVKSRCWSPWNKCMRSLSVPLPCDLPQWPRLMLEQWETAEGRSLRLRGGGEDAQRTHKTVSQRITFSWPWPSNFSTFLLSLLLHPDVHNHLIAAFAHLSLYNEFAWEACLFAGRLKQQYRVSLIYHLLGLY